MQPILTVIIFCYNQRAFISSAIDSALMQETNFPFRILISDDGSDDGTLEILEQYKTKFPNQIELALSQRNGGILMNALKTHQLITTPYIALLDGDDYWTNPQKLQIQVNFLNENPSYNGVFHDANIIHETEEAEKYIYSGKKTYSQNNVYQEDIYPVHIINRLILPTASAVLRSDFLKTIQVEHVLNAYSLDWKLYCYAIRNSKFKYINEPWSVYRNHLKGVSKSNRSSFHLAHIDFLVKLLEDTYMSYYKYEIYEAICKEYRILLTSKDGNISKREKSKLFRRYVGAEIKRIINFKKRLDRNQL